MWRDFSVKVLGNLFFIVYASKIVVQRYKLSLSRDDRDSDNVAYNLTE